MQREEYQFRAGDTEDGISVLIPTRKRGELLLKSIATLRDNAQAPWQIEFLVAYDNDDSETPRAIKGHDDITGINVGERRGWAGLHLYYADLISYATTDWYLMWCDDGLMHTPNWDVIARAQKPGVLHLQGGPANNHNVYPIVHRKVVEGVKYVIPSPHTDTWWTEIAAGAGCLYQVPIRITEDRFNETGNNNDQTYKEGSVHQYRQPEYYSAAFLDQRHLDMFRLAEACTNW
jgi:glycosyltransferase involved in cell wall biosynthesis